MNSFDTFPVLWSTRAVSQDTVNLKTDPGSVTMEMWFSIFWIYLTLLVRLLQQVLLLFASFHHFNFEGTANVQKSWIVQMIHIHLLHGGSILISFTLILYNPGSYFIASCHVTQISNLENSLVFFGFPWPCRVAKITGKFGFVWCSLMIRLRVWG